MRVFHIEWWKAGEDAPFEEDSRPMLPLQVALLAVSLARTGDFVEVPGLNRIYIWQEVEGENPSGVAIVHEGRVVIEKHFADEIGLEIK